MGISMMKKVGCKIQCRKCGNIDNYGWEIARNGKGMLDKIGHAPEISSCPNNPKHFQFTNPSQIVTFVSELGGRLSACNIWQSGETFERGLTWLHRLRLFYVIKVYESWVGKLSSNGASFSGGDKDQRVGRGAQGCRQQPPATWGRFSQNNWNRKKTTKNLGERGKSVTTGGDLPATDLWTASKVSFKHIWRHVRHRAIGHICPYRPWFGDFVAYHILHIWHKHCQRHNGPRHCFYNLIYVSIYKAGKFSRKENSS